ncbi:MAG: YafY family transcriptional regulator [Solirubrobacteraceae bacterium]|nr:YafY family transcriptional regulator [Solirubrobacteraceae bacterium]
MADPSSRMLRLLSLLQTHRFWLGEDLAGRLEVSERTLRRDVDRLRELGYPVAASRGVGGGYQLQAGSQLPPLLLDDEDAIAIAIGLRTAAGGNVEGMEEAAVAALTKLDQVLPPRLRTRVAALQESIAPALPMRPHQAVDLDVLTIVAQACRDEERLRFGYRRRDGEESERTVEPHRLVSLEGRWYLVAWDARRSDWRTFRLDRVQSPERTGSRCAKRKLPGNNAAEYVRQSIRSMPAQWTAQVRVMAPASELRPEIAWLRGEVEDLGDGTCCITTSGDSLEWLSVHLGFLAAHDYRVEGPPELIEFVRADAGRRARAVGASPAS